MRTPEEIRSEIAALKALRPVGNSAHITAKKIVACIRELEFPAQADLFGHTRRLEDEANEDIKSILIDVRNWKMGTMPLPPSKGWGKLVE